MTFYEEKQIDIPGFTIAFKSWNSEHSKPVLCLHGKMDNAGSFDLLAPLLPQMNIIAIDYPGTGFSSAYPDGVIPYWRNDAFLLLHLIDALKWEQFDIIAHSLGSLLATTLAVARPEQIGKIVFLDILGPTVNFIEKRISYFHKDVETYLTYRQWKKTIYKTQEEAIEARMKTGNISYQAARALALRGTKQCKDGWYWTFDERLRCVSSMLPYEDEIREMFKAINAPVCLIRAIHGVPYPEHIFKARAQVFQNLTIHELLGGHHIHMDDPYPVAKIITKFLDHKS